MARIGFCSINYGNTCWAGTEFLPGRAVARIGLRMMPPFPPPSLKFRKAGFPRYGFKAGISDSAFRSTASSSRRAVCFHPSCPSLPLPDPRSESRGAVAGTPPFKRLSRFTPGALVPVRVMLSRSIFTYSAPSAPLASTSRFHRHGLYGMPSLCVQRQRLGDQRVVPCFRWLFFIDMSSSETPGAPRLLTPSSFAVNACLRPGAGVSASPILLILRFS